MPVISYIASFIWPGMETQAGGVLGVLVLQHCETMDAYRTVEDRCIMKHVLFDIETLTTIAICT